MIIPNSDMNTCDASLRVKLGSEIMPCQRAKVEAISARLPILREGGCHYSQALELEWDALDIIRILGRNQRLGLRPNYKFGDNTKRRRGAFHRLSNRTEE